MRRIILVASLLFCRFALADDVLADPPPVPPPWKLIASTKPVSMEAVDKVIEANDRAVQSCNRNSRRADTLAVLMTLTIEPDGKVSSVEAVPEDQEGGKVPAEAACLARVAKRLKFPAAGTVSHVQYPFMIVPQVRRAMTF
jgi:hypothetical protein